MYNVDLFIDNDSKLGAMFFFDFGSHSKATKVIEDVTHVSDANIQNLERNPKYRDDIVVMLSVSVGTKAQAKYFLNKYSDGYDKEELSDIYD